MESLERFQQSRRVVEDFTSRSLAAIPTDYGRLFYVSSLRTPATGKYEHDGLNSLYSEESVQQALDHCSQELFSKIMEMRLDQQEWDLRSFLGRSGKDFSDVVHKWRLEKRYRTMCAPGMPEYLHELFISNCDALLSILSV